VGKKICQNDGKVVNVGIALDKDALEILRAKIMAILIEDLPVKEKEPKHYSLYNRKKAPSHFL